MKIGERIRAERESRDPTISAAQLARDSGVPYPTLAGIENGDQDSSTRLHDIAQALGVSPKWLETGKGNKYLVADRRSSYEMGFDLEKILDAQKLLREYAGVLHESPEDMVNDPRRVRIAYKIVDEDSRQQKRGEIVDLMKQLSAAFKEDRETDSGNQRRKAEGTGATDGGDRSRRKRKA